jgi:2-iminobutanoate/2-iminopropanoate deaminase
MSTTIDLTPVNTEAAPAPVGPYSQAVRAGNMLYVSGQMAIDPTSSEIARPSDVTAQTERVLDNLAAILDAAGASLASVAKTTIFLTDMANFAAVNEVYARRFGAALPARSCVAVLALPNPDALVEIEAVALLAAGPSNTTPGSAE